MSSRGPHQHRRAEPAGGPGLSPAVGAKQAEARIGKPCFYGGQKVQGLFACVACQFQINNRKSLPTCPDCGEIVWAYLGDGPRPVPEGETAEDGVQLDAPSGPVKVEENVKLDP